MEYGLFGVVCGDITDVGMIAFLEVMLTMGYEYTWVVGYTYVYESSGLAILALHTTLFDRRPAWACRNDSITPPLLDDLSIKVLRQK